MAGPLECSHGVRDRRRVQRGEVSGIESCETTGCCNRGKWITYSVHRQKERRRSSCASDHRLPLSWDRLLHGRMLHYQFSRAHHRARFPFLHIPNIHRNSRIHHRQSDRSATQLVLEGARPLATFCAVAADLSTCPALSCLKTTQCPTPLGWNTGVRAVT